MALALYESVSLLTDWIVRNPSLRVAAVTGAPARYLWGVNLLAGRAVWVVPLLTALGAFAATSLVYWAAPETHGHGTDSAIDAIHADPKGMRARTWPVKLIASALTLGSGGSGGTEGPTAQMSAAAASVLARWLKLNESQAKVAVAAGLAAGVGAIFRAPVGGAILGAELLYVNGFDFSVLVPSVIASGVAYLEFAAAIGFSPMFGRLAWMGLPLSAQMAAFPILGICAGTLARLYCKGFYTVAGWFERLKRNRGRLDLRPFRAAAAGLLVGLTGLFVPGVLGTGYALGYGIIERVLSADAILALPLALLILMPFVKLLATSLTVGSGGSGGVFGPGMVIGATAGAALWRLAEPHGLAPASPASLVIVGMAACLGAASHAPVAITVIAAEMCGSFSVLEPASIAVPIAVLVAGRPTLYASQRIKRKNRSESPGPASRPGAAQLGASTDMVFLSVARPAASADGRGGDPDH
jgi:chloride channel protein, CIC family